jgi:hypothetical protein
LTTDQFCSRPETKSDSSSKKQKPVSKLSHDLFGSGSFDEEDSGDLFSPLETAKELSTATPTVKAATPTSSAAKKGGKKNFLPGGRGEGRREGGGDMWCLMLNLSIMLNKGHPPYKSYPHHKPLPSSLPPLLLPPLPLINA